jgi:hypothetical protein
MGSEPTASFTSNESLDNGIQIDSFSIFLCCFPLLSENKYSAETLVDASPNSFSGWRIASVMNFLCMPVKLLPFIVLFEDGNIATFSTINRAIMDGG